MSEMTLDKAKEQLRLAKEAYRTVGGTFPEPNLTVSGDVSCYGLVTSAAVLYWFAAGAALQGGDATYYAQFAEEQLAAAAAQGCAV